MSCLDFADELGRPFEAGEPDCSDSCVIDTTACVVIDRDDDGLNEDAEELLGTDPDNPDTDGDGFTDSEEVDGGSDPLNYASWPIGTGKWPNRLADAQAVGLAGQGWGTGEIAPNIPLTDQFGGAAELHQFYGYGVVIAVGAVWCPPCKQAAATAQAMWDEHKSDGVIFIDLLVDGLQQGVDPTQEEIGGWAAMVVEKFEGYPGDAVISGKVNIVK